MAVHFLTNKYFRRFISIVLYICVFSEITKYAIGIYSRWTLKHHLELEKKSLDIELQYLEKLLSGLKKQDPIAVKEIARKLKYKHSKEKTEYIWL